MADCNHDCSSCASRGNCSSEIVKLKPAEGVNIKHVIGIMSGKGGVGKSLCTSMLACSLAKKGYKVGILDADITGPSIPQAFGIKETAMTDGKLIYPASTIQYGIKVISSNMLLETPDTPIIWRGSMISNLVKQFFNEVNWGVELDFLLIDMPPGTGDVALTTFQFLPIDGIIVMTSPQSLVSMIVRKAINMANDMNVPILGVVENMAYVECKNCKEKNYIFGRSTTKSIVEKFDIDLLAELPIREEIAINVDRGNVEAVELPEMDAVANKIIAELN